MIASPKGSNDRITVVAVSGGPDSVYLLRKLASGKRGTRLTAAHVNYGTRGRDSRNDQVLVENICIKFGIELNIFYIDSGGIPGGRRGIHGRFPAGFEQKARDLRYRFLRDLSEKVGAEAIALAHTADDQIETILMRVFEGAGIGGLKGIPRETEDGIVRPILDVWKDDILAYLKRWKIPYRIDRSNFDTRLERNWVRHALLPLLVKRYGKEVKKRIFTLGERFRELDDYIEAEACRWVKRNVTVSHGGAEAITPSFPTRFTFRRERYSALPTVVRVKILQAICYDHLGLAPGERLLKAMDRQIRDGGPSATVIAGKGWRLVQRYGDAAFLHAGDETSIGPAGDRNRLLLLPKGKITPAQAKRLAAKGDAEAFDASALRMPLDVRPLRAGDRILPFGLDRDKKVKEILIDRKVPREDRWGRPVVCDAEGAILWIPGVLRSAHAPVVPATRKTVLLRFRSRN